MNKPHASLEALIVFLEGNNAGSEIKVEAPKELLIGRSEQCDIFVEEKKVSRKHAKLTLEKTGAFLEDLQSTNGTFVDGKKVSRAELKDGDTIRIGMSVFRINFFEAKAPASVPLDIPVREEDDPEKPYDLMSDNLEDSSDIPEPLEKSLEPASIPPVVEKAKGDEGSQAGKGAEKKKALSGSLSEMLLPDILQMLKNNQRSGILAITRDEEEGEIYFVDGKLKGVRWGEMWGLKPIYRMLSFNEGSFDFQPLPDSFSEESIMEKIELPLENLLLEGMRQIDELEKIKKELPPGDTALEVNRECTLAFSKLHPKVLDVLQLVINQGKFLKIMNKSPLSDLETGKIIYYLLKKGYIASR